jgi:hypothetical protein
MFEKRLWEGGERFNRKWVKTGDNQDSIILLNFTALFRVLI